MIDLFGAGGFTGPGPELVVLVTAIAGFLSSVAVWRKVRPDVDTAAVTQAQGAAETMAVLQRELYQDRDEWRQRALGAESECRRLLGELEECQKAHGRRSRDLG